VLSAELGCNPSSLEQWRRTDMAIEWFVKPFCELHYITLIGSHPTELPARVKVSVMESSIGLEPTQALLLNSGTRQQLV
jgi:hypothetical protein